MLRTILVWAVVVITVSASARTMQSIPPASQPQASPSSSVATNREILSSYCVSCHNQKAATAGLSLERINLDKVSSDAAVWEKVVQKLRTGAMPPAGRPRPDKHSSDSLINYLETELDRASAANPNPGRPAVHRLNRIEYTNAIRDLLAVEIDADTMLPIDEVNHGFDNMGDILSVTPVLFERYMSAARKIGRMAIGEPRAAPVFEKYEIPKFLTQDDRISEDLPFGSRGGISIRYYFPVDGEYTIRVFLVRNSRDYIRGLDQSHQIDFRLDGERIKVLTVGGGVELKDRPGPPFSQAAQIGDPPSETYEHGGAEEHLEVRFSAKAGSRLVGVTFLNKNSVAEGVLRPPMTQFELVQYKGGNPYIDNIVISGPFDSTGISETPSRQKIFVCRPASVAEEEPCARKILSTLARRAYRRPVTEKDIRTLLRVYEVDRAEQDFDTGIQAALERILVGPEFLFRIERDPAKTAPDTAYRISDLELASRLSFFLWSSIPDDQLLDLAEKGNLRKPEILDQQIRRMLNEPRSRTLVTNFAGQWLYLRNIRSKMPDPELFPEFDENLREAFQQETELFVESTLRENQSALKLLDADYTFLNERLARHYGIPNVYGSHFRRVSLDPKFDARRGLLGQGSLLTVTSYANRTSVVLRGKWLLENLLGAPPPPPPANVPALEDSAPDGKTLPLRQLMEKHRMNAGCASCHAAMDPMGFALENFDAIGKWRNTDADAPIDSSGVLPDGTKLDGAAGLRNVLVKRPEEFVNVVAERMLTYALGRGLEYYDAPAVRKIVREAAHDDYRWLSLISATAKSVPFQMRRSQKP
jgi:mono/diheme cytochrome c family protein